MLFRSYKEIAAYKLDRQSKLRDAEHYFRPFNHKDMLHRSYFMKLYSKEQGLTEPTTEVVPGIPKWTAKLVRKLAATSPLLTKLLNNELSPKHPLVSRTVADISQLKADLYNKSYQAQIRSPEVSYPVFNPSSPKQKQELFELLGISSESTTASGSPQWDRDQVERVNRETDDPVVKELTEALITHSFAAVVRNNFIEGFYNYTIDGYLHSNLRLFGAKTFRLTSSKINLLNMPSTGSIFSSPIKSCFTAPPGCVDRKSVV